MNCTCGHQRVENAKFCSECGQKFMLSSEESFKNAQYNFLKEVQKQNQILEDLATSWTSDKSQLREQYLIFLRTLNNLINFQMIMLTQL